MNTKNVTPLRNKDTLLGSILLLVDVAFLIAVASFPDAAARYRIIARRFSRTCLE